MKEERTANFAARLQAYQIRFDNGDKLASFEAMRLCYMFKLDMPEWVIGSLVDLYDKYRNLEVKTLDEAFGVKKRTARFISLERKWMNNAFDVYLAFLDNERKGLALDTGFERGKANRFGINNDDAWKMYKEIRDNTEIGRGLETTRSTHRKKPP